MKLEATPACVELIELLKSKHGELMFHQSGGCCDGSSPMCYLLGEFKVGGQDVLIGDLAGCPFYIWNFVVAAIAITHEIAMKSI